MQTSFYLKQAVNCTSNCETISNSGLQFQGEEGSVSFATDTLAALTQKPLHELDKRFPETVAGHHRRIQTKHVFRRPSSAVGQSTETTARTIQIGRWGYCILNVRVL